jgi:uncharacterized protein YjiS (DUF1127 family)
MERDATGKTARAFYEFWNTGDEALPKKALAEKLCQLRRARRQRLVCGPAGATSDRKGIEMITLKMISEKFNAWRRYRDAVRELSQFSDHELCDIGIRRCDIENIVRRTGPRRADA